MNQWTSWVFKLSLVLASGVIPAFIAWWRTPPAQERSIHIEAFRYGKKPSVITCCRGDRLKLTFSSRDTGHSFFLEEFDLDVKIAPQNPQVTVFSPRSPTAPPRVSEEVIFVAEPPGTLGWLISKVQFRCHVWCGPLHAFEQGNLIIRPNILLHLGLGFAIGITVVAWIGPPPLRGRVMQRGKSRGPYKSEEDSRIRATEKVQGSRCREGSAKGRWALPLKLDKDIFSKRDLQLTQLAMILLGRAGLRPIFLFFTGTLLYLVILTSLFGTKVAGRNFGTMFTWVAWLGLLICIFIPLGGRLWCPLCPFPILGDHIRRFRQLATTSHRLLRWEERSLWRGQISPVISRVIVLLILGTFSTAIVAIPRVTGLVISGLLLLSIVTSLFSSWRFFCVYLCPIAAFLSTYAPLGWLSLSPKQRRTCERCTTRLCQLGSSASEPCPYGLWGGQKNLTSECGFCLECVKSCPFTNMRVAPNGSDETASETGFDVAISRIVLLSLAITYSLVHLGPWPELRTMVDIVDKGEWRLFVLFTVLLWSITLVFFPLCWWALTRLGTALLRQSLPVRMLMQESTAALLAPGVSIWIAFAIHLLFVNATFVLQTFSDPFGWGWNLMGMANTPWRQIFPPAIPWLQVTFVLFGHYFGLRSLQRIWVITGGTSGVRGAFPLSLGLTGITVAMVWFFAN